MEAVVQATFETAESEILYRSRHVRKTIMVLRTCLAITKRLVYAPNMMFGAYTNLLVILVELSAAVWQKILPYTADKSDPKHLLWALLVLKNYYIESVNDKIIGVCRNTFRLWAWRTIGDIAEMDVVSETIGTSTRKYCFKMTTKN